MYPEGPTRLACRDISDAMSDRAHELVAVFTPVESGNLRSSWYREPAVRTRRYGFVAYRSTVATEVDYAPHVEHGTGLWGPSHSKYEILPVRARALSWITRVPIRMRDGRLIPAGTRVFAMRVMHPGSRGRHMMARAVAFVDASLDQIARPALAKWEREMESVVAVRRLT
jgi:hypothetical protein